MSTASPARPVDVVVQTHWDREWYLPHQTSVARLLEVMARVLPMLEDGRLDSFLFDGQTAAFEDLLAHAEPAMAARARALAAQGRLLLGPWYVMADEFLVSGESLLRNLEVGLADVAAATGRSVEADTTVGYLPDTFGHIAQMPMLLRQFGIGRAVLWRGADAPHSEFDWAAPDGSVVGTVFLTEGYYQHALNLPGHGQGGTGHNALLGYLDRIAARALSPRLLLTQGGDHLLPAADLPQRMAAFNAAQPAYHLQQATLAAHVAAALMGSEGRRATLHGELRHNRQAFVLPDVLSTRRGLKHQHRIAEERLLGETEPLLAQLMPLPDWPTRYLDTCWRLLIQQQAHDSICGCSTDAVHREMATRFTQLAQRLDALRDRAAAAGGLQSLLQHEAADAGGRAKVFADDARLSLFNPLPQAFDGWQVLQLQLRADTLAGVTVRASTQGVTLPAVLLSATPDAIFRSPLDDFPDRLPSLRCEVAVRVSVPGLTALPLEVAPITGTAAPPAGATAGPTGIDNAVLALALDTEGRLVITHKASGLVQRGVLAVQHEFDAGDSYNFSPPHGAVAPQRQVQARWQLLGVSVQGEVREMRLALTMAVSAALDETRQRGRTQTVVNEGELCLRLLGDEPAVRARLVWINRACDQRTRLLWPCGDAAALRHTAADTAFAWLQRPVTLADVPATPTRAEAPVAVNPSLSALAAGPWWLAHRAMHEFEIQHEGGQAQLAVTLVRSVGWLSRRDLRSRGVGAGPDIATPEAQSLGSEVFEFHFGLHPGLGADADGARRDFALDQARRLLRPLLALRGQGGTWREGVEIGNARVQISAVRRLPARPGAPLELRLWNPTDTAQALALTVADWQAVRADGMPCPDAATSTWAVAPHGLLSLRQRSAGPL
ncbi:hypothetical protein [Rubrivivax rivuli]|uniref:Glycoside hydrolase family 38 central domain-containing protein n=1 Tax=Rubrivivax rivuli TaxID=1862385 RepID=A0A437RH03_9BURK|nr:hypothetical protein [Rubrivivax rivuli]RVU46032.1 hypothetical protein EOE66_09160 [Rubrivivax rivuli]